MYVRIARFEGGERDWDDFAKQVREEFERGGRGTPLEHAMDAIKRVMLLADRESGGGANLILCDTEADMRRVDEAMNAMTPGAGRGARTSVELYEVLLDIEPAG